MARGVLVSYGFNGMNNVWQNPSVIMDDLRRITPRIVLNARVLDDGRLIKRQGYRKLINLPNAHSLWSGSIALVVAQDATGPALYQISGNSCQKIGRIGGPAGATMEYVEVGKKVFMSNGWWTGCLDLKNSQLDSWGLPLPPTPQVSITYGELPPGVYKLCYTFYEAPDRLSGNGPLVTIAWDGGNAGLRLHNLPDNGLAWITQPNGRELYLAPVKGDLIDSPYYTQPLLSFGVQPPPPMRALALAFGRIWGAVGSKVYYSDEFQYEWFRSENYLPFTEEIVMIVPVNTGLFVNSWGHTWFLSGTHPDHMKLEMVGLGAIPGTLTWVLVEGGGYEISRRFSRLPSPIWVSKDGVVVGTHTGNVVHISKGRIMITPRAQGAAISYDHDGQPITIISLNGNLKGNVATDIQEINIRNRLYKPAPKLIQLQGGGAINGGVIA